MAAADATGGNHAAAGCVGEFQHGVVAEAHRAGHAADGVTLIDRRMAGTQGDEFVHPALARAGVHAQVKLSRGGGFQRPVTVGGVAVRWMLLARKWRRVAAKRHAEKIPAQHLEHDRQVRCGRFLRPRVDGKRLDFLIPDAKRHGSEVTACCGHIGLDLVANHSPRGLAEHVYGIHGWPDPSPYSLA